MPDPDYHGPACGCDKCLGIDSFERLLLELAREGFLFPYQDGGETAKGLNRTALINALTNSGWAAD